MTHALPRDEMVERVVDSLRRRGCSETEAWTEIEQCFMFVLWEGAAGRCADDDLLARFHAVLEQVEQGQRVANIWPEMDAAGEE